MPRSDQAGNGMAELAVVIMAVGAPRMVRDAVRSILAQAEPCEIVVVNSGGGDAAARVRGLGVEVRVIAAEGLLLPGATRNRGIVATTAPFVAFLAADCLACPGWAAERLRAHRSGAAMVATAVMPDRLQSRVAWAAHLALHARRLPQTPPAEAALYGVSYARTVFESCGLFDESLRIGEDSAFNARAADFGPPVWTPQACAIHRTPRFLAQLLVEQHGRGWRAGAHLRRQGVRLGPAELSQIRESRVSLSLRMARVGVPEDFRATAVRAAPLIRLAQAVYVRGAARGNRSRHGTQAAEQ